MVALRGAGPVAGFTVTLTRGAGAVDKGVVPDPCVVGLEALFAQSSPGGGGSC